jgi:serine/threonine protein kinase
MKIPSSIRWKHTGKTLGEGGQAAVFEVTDSQEEFQGLYALKAIKPGKPEIAYQRFGREVEVIRGLRHKAIIEIIDSSIYDTKFPYYVMPLHEGAISLKKEIQSERNRFCCNTVASIQFFLGLLDGISKWESAGIVHRDLSPANILLLQDQSLKVIDFGLCQSVDGDTFTLEDEGVGTPNYMAPECESGTSDTIDSRADLYSAGKILWSAVTSQFAFSREKPAFSNKSMQKIYPDLPSTWHLHEIFSKTIRHDKGNRWKSAAIAIPDVKRILYLVQNGIPSLEMLASTCPLCGIGTLNDFPSSHSVFGNPNPSGFGSGRCSHCGYCFVRDYSLARKNLADRGTLE